MRRRMHPVASGAVARTVSFVPTAIASLVASRLIISHFGIPAFDGFTVAESLIVLVPLGDLGVGSAITAAFASQDPTGREVEGVVLTAARITAVAAVLLGVVSIAMAAGGLWTTVLGSAFLAVGRECLLIACAASKCHDDYLLLIGVPQRASNWRRKKRRTQSGCCSC